MKIKRCATSLLASLLFLLAALAGCASTGAGGSSPAPLGPLAREGASFGAQGMSAFARENLATFTTFTLSNGIPVVVKRNAANAVEHISLVLRGGSLLATPATAGYESLALSTMARASARYGYDDIRAALDETSSSIRPSSAYEYSTYSLTTLDKYFDRLFPIWADTLVAPRLAQSDFDQVLSEAKLALQGSEKDPWAKTGLVMNESFFKDHPFVASPDGTEDSLAAATLAAVRQWYANSFSANRMFVVAVGDYDIARLKGMLEKGLGGIPDRKVALPPSPPPFTPESGLIKYEFPQSKGLGYIRGDFVAPAPGDPDYMPMNLGMKMLSDLLFNVVRDKYGAVYSPDSYIRSLGVNYGSIALYKTKSAGKIKAYVDEAVADMAAGKVMSLAAASSDPMSSGQMAAGERMTVAEALPIYKAQYINEVYAKQQTNRAIARLIIQSVITTGDYRSYLLDVDRINAVTAEQIQSSFKKYVLDAKIVWVALGSADVLLPITSVDYEGLGPK